MKFSKVARILLIILITFISLVLLVYLLLWLPPVQQKIKDIALTEVMKKTHNRMSIGKLKFRPFNQLQLEDVCVSDLKGDTLLSVHQLSAGFDLMALLNNRLLIQSVMLDDFTVQVSRDSVQAPFNFQFLIDAFTSPDTTKKEQSGSLVIEIDQIQLKRGKITYNILSEPVLPDTLFDSNHIYLFDLESNIRLSSIDLQKLDAAIKQLSFKEKSGFELKDLQLVLTSKEKKILLDKGIVLLPQSKLAFKESWLDYTGFELSQLIQGASYSLSVELDSLWPSDLKAFYPPLSRMQELFSLKGQVAGIFPEVKLSSLKADYGKHIALDADASIENFNEWKNTQVHLNLNHFFIDSFGMGEILLLTSTKEQTPTKAPFHTEPITVAGKFSGSLPDLVLNLNAQSKTGNLDLKGKGGYLYDTGHSHFDIQLVAKDFDLRTFMKGDTLYGKTSFSLKTQGEVTGSGSINAKGSVSIDRFDFNRYSYHDVHAKVSYLKDSLAFNLVSDDPSVGLEINGAAGLGKRYPNAKVYAQVHHLRLDTLNFLSSYPGADVKTIIQAEVQGFDPESMKARLQLDSLFFETSQGTWEEPSLEVNFQALPGSEKHITIDSKILQAKMDGHFTFATLFGSLTQTLSSYLPNVFSAVKKKSVVNDELDFYLTIQNTEQLSSMFGLPVVLKDSAVLQGRYASNGRIFEARAQIPRFSVGATPFSNAFLDLKADTVNNKMLLLAGADQWYETPDTTSYRLRLENINQSLALLANFKNHTPKLAMSGSVDANIHFIPVKGRSMPDMEIQLNPTSIEINEENFKIEPSRFIIQDKRYTVENFEISHSESEYLKLNGAVSALPVDTLIVDLARLRLQTLANAFNLDLKLGGEANGKVVINQLLSTPLILTEGFSINDISLADKKIGTLNLISEWNAARSGLFFKVNLTNPGMTGSTLEGTILPKQDSLFVKADIQGIMMDWLEPFTAGTLYGLGGELGAKFQARGSLKTPQVNGVAFFKDATIGVSMLNTRYSLSDSVFITPKVIDFKEFTIRDEKQQTAVIKGSVSHQSFSKFYPTLGIDFNDFMVINNPNQTDSLFYGNLRIKGHLDASLSGKDILLKAKLTHGSDSKVMVNIPQSASEAQQYGNITFVNSKGENLDSLATLSAPKASSFSLPIKMNISFSVTPELTLGAVINPATKDAVEVSGTGLIDFSYDLNSSAMNLLGDYVVKEGKATLSLKNITRKTFTVQEGGKLTFKGDPMATAFDVTAVYATRADLTSLDNSFSEIMSTSTKVIVNCLLTATGDLNKMGLKYRVFLPGQREEIQQKVDGLLYTDDIRIREIAYLLAFGTFLKLNSDGSKDQSNIWTSLASSSITSQLNNLLSGVMSENWSIGTDLRSNDGGFSDVEMDVNVSTRLFDDRLILSSNIGYRNAANSGNQNNFTGDFDMQYKLNRTGNIVLKVYNVTNNQYYETARTTQGVGLIYRKDARTFKGLFRKIKAIFK